jgi:hypothetical protein
LRESLIFLRLQSSPANFRWLLNQGRPEITGDGTINGEGKYITREVRGLKNHSTNKVWLS